MTADHKKIGLALGGGGARGLAHIGVFQVLEENHIPIDMISGTSFGALAGSLYAMCQNAQATENMARDFLASSEFTSLGFERVKKRQPAKSAFVRLLREICVNIYLTCSKGFLKEDKLYHILQTVYGQTGFKDLKIPFASISGDLSTGLGCSFTSGNLVKAIQASISLPRWMEPVHYNGHLYADGYAHDIVPVEACRDLGADIVIAVDVSTRKAPDPIHNAMDAYNTANNMACVRSTDKSLAAADMVISPDVSAHTWIEFDCMDEFIAAGRLAAEKALKGNVGLLSR